MEEKLNMCLWHALPDSERRPESTRHISSSCAAHGECSTATSRDGKAHFAVCLLSGTRQRSLPCVRGATRQIKVIDGGAAVGTVTARGWGRRLPTSPCARIWGTRQRFKLRRVPEPAAHGKVPIFAVCKSSRHTAKSCNFAVCHTSTRRSFAQERSI